MKATTKDLRLHTRQVMAATERGEEVIITYRGKPRARLIPWTEDSPAGTDAAARNPAFGIWRDRNDDVDKQVRDFRQPRDFG